MSGRLDFDLLWTRDLVNGPWINTANIAGRRDLTNMTPAGTLSQVIDGTASAQGVLLPKDEANPGEIILAVALKMQESAGNEYQGQSIGDSFNVMLHATQYTYEEDAFGPDYDAEAKLPEFGFPENTFNVEVTGNIEVDDNNRVKEEVVLTKDGVSVTVPVGVKVDPGVTALTLKVVDKTSTDSNVTLNENEVLRPIDVHVEGVAEDNDIPMAVSLHEAASIGLNEGNLKLYHVEDGETMPMEYVNAVSDLNKHNQFTYDPVTGNAVLSMATFSEVAMTANTENKWNGNYDTSWYNTADTVFAIASADQLAGFGAIVGGMAEGIKQDGFVGKTVKLISDINLGDDEENNNEYHFASGDKTYVNPGILSMTSNFDGTDITDNTNSGYVGMNVSYNAGLVEATGYLYSLPASGNSVDNGYDTDNDSHKDTVQGDYLPTFTFNLGDQADANDGEDDTYYVVYENGKVEALYQSGKTPISLDLTTLATVTKYKDVSYDVTASCKDASGNVLATDKTVTLTESGNYTLVFTVVDDVFFDANGNAINKSVTRTYEVPLTVSVKEAAIPNATIKINNTSIAGEYEEYRPYVVTVEGYYYLFNPLSAITVTDYDANGNGTTVDLTANISSTTVTYGDEESYAWAGATITITYYDNRILTIVLGKPSGLNSPSTSNGGKTITVTNGGVKSDGYTGDAAIGTWPITSYSFKGNNQTTVVTNQTVTVNFTAPSSSSSGGGGCVTPDTLITLADGTQKEIQHVRVGDEVLAWNFYTGKYEVMPVSLLQAHSTGVQNVLHLYFEDGTELKILGEHGVFDADLNTFVFVDEFDAADYVGHHFVKQDGQSFATVKLVDYEVATEYTTAYTILSTSHYNVLAEGMFTVTPAHVGGNFFNPFDIGEDMKYDDEAVKADIEKYGLYTYEDFDNVLTYEQFVALNLGHFKVSVGKGYVTYDGLIYLIENFINNEDFDVCNLQNRTRDFMTILPN